MGVLRNGPPDAVRISLVTCCAVAGAQALVCAVMFAVDRDQLRSALRAQHPSPVFHPKPALLYSPGPPVSRAHGFVGGFAARQRPQWPKSRRPTSASGSHRHKRLRHQCRSGQSDLGSPICVSFVTSCSRPSSYGTATTATGRNSRICSASRSTLRPAASPYT